MTIGLSKEATRCSMLPDGDDGKQEQESGTKNPISDDGSGIPAVVFGRRGMCRLSLQEPLAEGVRMPEVQLPQRSVQDRGLSAH